MNKYYYSYFVKTNNLNYGSRILGNYETRALAEYNKARLEQTFGACEIIKRRVYFGKCI